MLALRLASSGGMPGPKKKQQFSGEPGRSESQQQHNCYFKLCVTTFSVNADWSASLRQSTNVLQYTLPATGAEKLGSLESFKVSFHGWLSCSPPCRGTLTT